MLLPVFVLLTGRVFVWSLLAGGPRGRAESAVAGARDGEGLADPVHDLILVFTAVHGIVAEGHGPRGQVDETGLCRNIVALQVHPSFNRTGLTIRFRAACLLKAACGTGNKPVAPSVK